jgi:hypothetical protein
MSERDEVLPTALQVFNKFRQLEPCRKDRPEMVKERLDMYFAVCSQSDLMPSVESMCLALGISRVSAFKWEKDTTCESGRLISRAKDICNAMLTQSAMNGSTNVVYAIWLQKNNAGYLDAAQKIEISNVSDDATAAIEEKMQGSGLIWSEQLGDYILDGSGGGSD